MEMSQAAVRLPVEQADDRTSLSDVIRAGRRAFQSRKRIDLREIARAVGVGRTSLYRWVGSREKLIALVVASLAESAIRRADEQVPVTLRGPDRVAAVLEVFLRGVAGSAPLREFIQREPEVAARVLLSTRGDVTQRIEIAWEQLLIRSVPASRRPAEPTPKKLASMIVRLADAFYYADLIGQGEPDIESAILGLRMLLKAYWLGNPARNG
jgi:AcrR family transcriptional regulator